MKPAEWLTCPPGTLISDVADMMCRKARAEGVTVKLDFNGFMLIAFPHYTPANVMAPYIAEIERRVGEINARVERTLRKDKQEMPQFSVGEIVKAKVSAQGLEAGRLYIIIMAQVTYLPTGPFVKYTVCLDRGSLSEVYEVLNGHLLFEPTEPR